MSSLSFILLLSYVYVASCQELKILVGDKKPAIYDVRATSNSIPVNTINIINISSPVDIDYDVDNDVMYWADDYLRQIWSRNLITYHTSLVLTLDEGSILTGLALDQETNQIFYTDSGNDVIASVGTDGLGVKILIDTGLDQPRAVVLDKGKRLMYWSDLGTKPYIARADFNGNDVTKIVTSDLKLPRGLTLDRKNDVLYWCDAQTHMVEAVNVDGTGRRLVMSEPGADFYDIFYFNEALFFTDWTKRAVMNFPAKDGVTRGMIIHSKFVRLTGLYVYATVDYSDCQMGTYGSGCVACGHCATSSVCDKTTGSCLAGCSAGYHGHTCNQECPHGTYGHKCGQVCKNCLDDTCHHVTGNCTKGCIPGMQGLDCSTLCPPNTYGSCNPCGQCKDREPCVVSSGYCPTGCEEGWTGSRCNTRLELDDGENTITDDSGKVTLIGGVAGGVVVVLIIGVVIVVVLVFLMRRKQRAPKPDSDYASLEARSRHPPGRSDLPPHYDTIDDLQMQGHSNPVLTHPAPCKGTAPISP